jgi:hypothetical protein
MAPIRPVRLLNSEPMRFDNLGANGAIPVR